MNPSDLLIAQKLLVLTKPHAKTLVVSQTPERFLPTLEKKPHQALVSVAPRDIPKDLSDQPFDTIVLPNSLTEHPDAQTLLESLHQVSSPKTRLLITHTNNLWQPRLKKTQNSWLSRSDIKTLCHLARWEPFKTDGCTLIPSNCPLFEPINQYAAPLLPPLQKHLVTICRKSEPRKAQKVSIIVPVRNEEGNIPTVLPRIPLLQKNTEILFVEGHSKDNTWEALQRLPAEDNGRTIRILRQPGKGKGDAVRHGFSHAQGDLLLILDGDLTMPPEEIPKYIGALEGGLADFANGSRLVYLMEDQAMQAANLIANKGFGLAFSFVLKQPIKDTLCGTKCLWKEDYEEIAANRHYFGHLDPFGDFDLLLGASLLHLKILDIPIHYKERTYGETNIQRWKHGLLLARMLALAAKKLQFHPCLSPTTLQG